MKVKVCGMRDPSQIVRLDAMGVDFIGLIFHPESPRYLGDNSPVISPAKASLTGVFVRSSTDEILITASKFGLNTVQLHGGQNVETCEKLKKAGLQLIKVFHPSVEGFNKTEAFAHCTDYLLFDSGNSGSGGSGKKFDWKKLDQYTGKTPFLLGGGIGYDDLGDILQIRHSAFAGVDLNSKFELVPGIKNLDLIKQFINNLRL